MSRKELYAKVKELGIAGAIKAKFGDNYTRVSNSDLESFLRGFGGKGSSKKVGKKEATPRKSEDAPVGDCPCKAAIIKLLSTLQARRTLTAVEAEEIAAML